MDDRKVLRALLDGLGPWMQREGFGRQTERDAYSRLQGQAVQSVVPTVVCWTSSDYWDVHCHLELRFDEVEELLNRYKPHLSATQGEHTVTVRHVMEDLLPEGDDSRPLSLVMARDVPDILPDLEDRLSTYGLLYLHRWSTLKRLERGYLGDSEMWPEADPIRRFENLLAIAVLDKDRAKFDAVVRDGLGFMAKHRGGFYLKTFEGIAQGLSNDESWHPS